MSDTTSPRPPAPRLLVIAAYAAVYVIWGSTYLAIRIGVESIPPFLMAGLRFSAAGLVLLAVARAAGARWPTWTEWRRAAVVGCLMLVAGNGLVVWAERHVASAVAALVIATTPLWFVLLDWARPGGVAPSRRAAVGVGLGLAGVATLSFRGGGAAPLGASPLGLAGLLVASLAWALGSLKARHAPRPGSLWAFAAAQMLTAGVVLLAIGAACGELHTAAFRDATPRSWFAVGYLVVLGSWVGYSAYVWLLRVEPPARTGTYAYVNPAVAVFLGWALGGEAITRRMAAAGILILAGVVCLLWPVRRPAVQPAGSSRRTHSP